MKKLILLSILCIAAMTMNAQLIKNDFLIGYHVNDNLEKGNYANTAQDATSPILINQWNESGKVNANDQSGVSPKVVAPLYYTNYVQSGTDFAIDLLKMASSTGRTSIYSLASDNTYGAGTYYLAFLVNVSVASVTSPSEFLSFDGNYTGNSQRVRFTAKGIDASTYSVALGDAAAAAASVFNQTALNYGQTYLCVLKATIDASGAGTSWLFLNPNLTSTEPSATTAFSTSGITGLVSIKGVVVRQRSTTAAQVSGIRFASSWSSAIGISTGISQVEKNSSNIAANGKTIVTTASGNLKMYNLAGSEVLSSKTEGKLITSLSKGLYLVRFVGIDGKVESSKVEIK